MSDSTIEVPVDIRTGKPLKAAETVSADLGHPPCPKCGSKQSHEVQGAAAVRHCANCGNMWEE